MKKPTASTPKRTTGSTVVRIDYTLLAFAEGRAETDGITSRAWIENLIRREMTRSARKK